MLASYKNGNYTVKLYEDGTKIRETSESSFIPQYPESIDVKITNCCDMGCAYCHENSTPDGKHADFDKLINYLEGLPSGTELAIGGGNPLAHPNLTEGLTRLKERGFICNITVNYNHGLSLASDAISHPNNIKYRNLLDKLTTYRFNDTNLIYGVGVSWDGKSPFLNFFNNNGKHIVYHFIIGIIDFAAAKKFILGTDANILLLGYKNHGRGIFFDKSKEIKYWRDNIWRILSRQRRGSLSFDNLALEQLEIQKQVSEKDWAKYYMGADGEFSMYVDAVNGTFAKSSVCAGITSSNNVCDDFLSLRKAACKDVFL